MELELKNLAPYLHYNLDVYRESPRTIGFITRMTTGVLNIYNEGYYDVFKPILRPLSDLRKYRNEIAELQEINNDVTLLYTSMFDYKGLSVWEYEFLLENHFDVFGLIEKGLAIDINTLNKE